MRRKSRGSSPRLQFGRKLGCERLEQRALLTGLITAAEIAPIPVQEFKVHADSFVTSALDHVLATQNQKPVNFSKEDPIPVTQDGRSGRLTYYTVELDTPRTSVANPGIQPASGGPATAATIAGGTTRSNIVFSFLVYADNSVSIRAKLNNPPNWIGFSSSNFDLHERLRVRSALAEDSRITSSPAANIASDASEAVGLSELAEGLSNSSESVVNDKRRAAAEAETADGEVRKESQRFDSLASEMFWLEFEGSVVAEAETQPDDLGNLALAAVPAAGQTQVDFETHLAMVLKSSDLPVPPGMVPLDFATEAAVQQTVASAPPASAIYQVFVHSSEVSDLAAEAGSETQPIRPAADRAPDVQESAPSRWRGTTVALASLLGGLAWGLRARRDDPAT